MNLQWKSVVSIDNALRVATKCHFMASAVCISLSQRAGMVNREEQWVKANNGKHHFAVLLLHNCGCVYNDTSR